MKSLLQRLLPDAHKYDDRLHLQKVLYACLRDKKITQYAWFLEKEGVRRLDEKQVEEKTTYYTSLLNAE